MIPVKSRVSAEGKDSGLENALLQSQQESVFCARECSPLVIGEGIGEHFIGSDPLALLQVTDRFIYLEEGDIACLTQDQATIWDKLDRQLTTTERPVLRYEHGDQAANLG